MFSGGQWSVSLDRWGAHGAVVCPRTRTTSSLTHLRYGSADKRAPAWAGLSRNTYHMGWRGTGSRTNARVEMDLSRNLYHMGHSGTGFRTNVRGHVWRARHHSTMVSSSSMRSRYQVPPSCAKPKRGSRFTATCMPAARAAAMPRSESSTAMHSSGPSPMRAMVVR